MAPPDIFYNEEEARKYTTNRWEAWSCAARRGAWVGGPELQPGVAQLDRGHQGTKRLHANPTSPTNACPTLIPQPHDGHPSCADGARPGAAGVTAGGC